MASSNITIWVSQVSSSFTSLWGNNAAGDTQFSAATADEAFTNRAIVASENLRAFTFAQLRAATRNFRRDMVVGRGGFGKVYKGWQEEKVPSRGIKKSPIAVKTLDLTSRQGFKEWMVCLLNCICSLMPSLSIIDLILGDIEVEIISSLCKHL